MNATNSYLITGGAGFIGSHLCEHLLKAGHHVTALDNLSTGDIKNIQHLTQHPNFKYIEGSILDETVMEELVKNCDHIVHLAAAVGVKYIIDNPLDSLETNVRGTHIVLKLADLYKRPLLLASTSEVYGKQTHAPLNEEDACVIGPTSLWRWSYACSKAMDEFWALAYARSRKLPVTIVRFFNTVGPRQTGRYGMVIPRFVSAALKGDPIHVHGDGKQSRTFTHVHDAIRAMLALLDCPEARGQVVNIGGIEEVTIADLANRIKKLCNSSSPIQNIPYAEVYPEGFEDMPRRVPDTSKLLKLTNIKAQHNLDSILQSVINDARSHNQS